MKIRKTKQIKTEIPLPDYERLECIVKKYKFKSNYQLMKYLIRCFIKVADPKPEEVVNRDIEEMFEGYETASRDDFNCTKRGGSI